MQKYFLFFMLFFGPFIYGQQTRDSAWVSPYIQHNKTDSLHVSDHVYNKLYSTVYKLPVYTQEELNGFAVRPLMLLGKELLKISALDQSYTAAEIKETTLEKYLKQFEQFTFPFSSIITANLASAIDLPTNAPELLAHDNVLSLKSKELSLVSTNKALQECMQYDSISLHTQKYLRLRLLDFIVGSYSKTKEDILWEQFSNGSKLEFVPVVHSYYNQFMQLEKGYAFLAKLLPAYQHLESYVSRINRLDKVSKPLFGLDVNLLSAVPYSVWEEEVAFIQEVLTQTYIKGLIEQLPRQAHTPVTNELLEIIYNRVSNLKSTAQAYYKIVSKHKVVRASKRNDIVLVDQGTDAIAIKIFNEKEGKNSLPVQHYSFPIKETKEIWIYGLAGNDYFELTTQSSSVPICLIGGKQLDTYVITGGKSVTIFDDSKQTQIVQKSKAKTHLSHQDYMQNYDVEKHANIQKKIRPILGANPDDGIFLGAAAKFTVNKFKRNPFTKYHELQGIFYSDNLGVKLRYYGEIANIYKSLNAFGTLGYQSSNYSTNFFGFGNETPNYDDNLTLDYNRVKMSVLNAEIGIKQETLRYKASASLFYERVTIDKTPDRFVSSATLFFPHEEFFEPQNYTGAKVNFEYFATEVPGLEQTRVRPGLAAKFSLNTNDTQKIVTKLDPSLFIEQPLLHDKISLSTQVAYQYAIGDVIEFYQGAFLGGDNGLRGYRNQRFTGQSAFSVSNNLNWLVKELKSEVLPLQFGIFGGFDLGRVWVQEEESSQIHTSYGSGFWLQSANLVKGSLQAFGSDEGLRFNFKLSFGF